MSDNISRQAAIDLAEWFGERATYDNPMPQGIHAVPVDEIENLPSAEPQWILCSEKLPEDGTEVFVYLFNRPSPYIAWIEDCRWYTEDFEVESENEPIAWMPLPEPARLEKD